MGHSTVAMVRSAFVAGLGGLAGAVLLVAVAAPARAVIANPGGIGTPAVVAKESSPVFDQDVFETGTDHRVVHWLIADNTRPTARLDLGGYAVGGVGAASSFDSNLPTDQEIVAVRGRDDAVWYRVRSAVGRPWSGWRSLGGAVTAPPQLTGLPNGDIVFLVRGTNGAPYERVRSVDGRLSAAWRRIAAPPMAGVPAIHGVQAVLRGTDDRLWTAHRDLDGTWSTWSPATLPADVEPAGNPAIDSVGVYVRGSDGACWVLEGDPAGWVQSHDTLGGAFLPAIGFAAAYQSDGVVGQQWAYGRGMNGKLYVQTGSRRWAVLQ